MLRRIVEDYECRLVAVDAQLDATATGKAEHERYGNGEVELSVRVRGVPLADGVRLEVHMEIGDVGSIVLKNGRGELKIESRAGAIVPAVKAGDRILLTHDGKPLLAGVFAPD